MTKRDHNHNFPLRSASMMRIFTALLLTGVLAACSSTPNKHSTLQHRNHGLKPGQLETHGIAFLTPSTITGKEEDKQILALAFSEVLIKSLPNVRCVTLPETLGAINRNGLTGQYKQMYLDYAQTGIFERDTLSKVSTVSGARYLAKLNLADFSRFSQGRWGVVGVRVLATKATNIRVFLQIWDGTEGSIVWEGMHELSLSYDTTTEKPVTFKEAAEEAARNLFDHLPK